MRPIGRKDPPIDVRFAALGGDLDGQPIPNFPEGRRSGRTEVLIELLVNDLKRGLPAAVVIGHTKVYTVEHLLPRVMEALQQTGIEPERRQQTVVMWNGSRIDFESVSMQRRPTIGRRAGEYWDHYAAGEE